MKRPFKLILFIFLGTLLSLFPIQAQDDGLLTNPGFESPYVTKGGEPERLVAEGWEPWHVPPADGSSSAENQQPEYDETAPDDTRIRSGNNAQQYFTFFATHTGGVYQRVAGITPDTELRFSVYAYIWSSTFEDVDLSESPGDVIVYVGIDPTGGTDGTSDDIIWSPPAPNQYDAYREYSVIATATGDAVTVFVRSIVDFPVQNNYIYLDDAALVPTTDNGGVTPETPSATPTATVTASLQQPSETPDQDPTPTGENVTPDIVTPDPSQPPVLTQPPFEPTNTPTTAPVESTREPTTVALDGTVNPTNFPNTILHTVRRGDTVSRLAVLYDSTTEAIIRENALNEDGLIFVGQGLNIPVRLPAPSTITPTPTPPLQVIVVTATQSAEFGTGGALVNTTYLVQPGDTLFRIARAFNTSVAQLAQLNGIANPNLIKAGQTLLISTGGGTGGTTDPIATSPPIVLPGNQQPSQPATYVVRPGDNLYRISLRFNTTMRTLVNANNIANVNLIFAGQTLVIP